MVLKRSRYGLNTGNTIRRYARESRLHEQQRYSSLAVISEVGEDASYAARNAVRELGDMFPSTDHIEIEYSLNKQWRWELSDCITELIDSFHGDPDIQMKLTVRNKKNKKSLYTNQKQANKSKNYVNLAREPAQSEIRVSHGPQPTGKLYKVSHSERRKKYGKLRHQLKKECKEDAVTDVYNEDGDMLVYRTNQSQSQPIKPSHVSSINRRPLAAAGQGHTCYVLRNRYRNKEGGSQAEIKLEELISSAPTLPVRPLTPPHSEVLIKRSDVDIKYLAQKFGRRYREAYCTPRIFTLDLSGELGPEANKEKFFLVVMLRDEIKDVDCGRICCTGNGISWELSPLSTVMQGVVYDICTLIDLALCHRVQCLVDKSASTPRRPVIGGKVNGVRHKQVKSIDISPLVGRIIRKLRQYYQKADRELVVVPSMQCTICLEDINDGTLHTAVLPCLHDFCNLCWNRHLNSSIYQGLVHITCMQCNTQLDSVFIMSMVEFSTYCLYEVLLAHNFLSRDQVVKSCPALSCNKVLHCDDKLAAIDEPITASCKCGNECCFKCLKEPHWPLTCEQFTTYNDLLLRDVRVSYCQPIYFYQSPQSECIGRSSVALLIDFDIIIHMASAGGLVMGNISSSPEMENACSLSSCGHANSVSFPQSSHRRPSPLTSTDYYIEAYNHRAYNLLSFKRRLRRHCKQFLHAAPGNPSKLHIYPPIHQYLHQIVEQVLATHNLLEYCCAVNVFKKGSKYCVPTISLLSYSVDVLERQLSSGRCNQYTVDRLAKYYVIVKSNTQILVHKMSQLLKFLEPSISC